MSNLEHQGRVFVRATETAARAAEAIRSETRGVIGRALAAMTTDRGLLDGAERDFFDAAAQKSMIGEITRIGPHGEAFSYFRFPSAGDSRGIFVPWDVLARAMSTSTGPRGGFAVGLDMLDPVDILRPFSMTGRMPVQTVQLNGQGAVPMTGSAVTVSWQGAEGVAVTPADPAIGQGSLTPHLGMALTAYSRQLEAQSTNWYDYLAGQLIRSARTALEKAMLMGAGGAEPLGILNYGALIKMSGASLPWSGSASVLRMRRTVADANADVQSLAWVATPAVREVLAAREIVATSGRMICSNEEIDGRPAYETTNMPAGTLLLGDFSRVLIGFWGGGIAVEVDPNYEFNKGNGAIRVTMVCDSLVLNIGAFVAATAVT